MEYNTGWEIHIHDDGVVEFSTDMDNFSLDEWIYVMRMYDVDVSTVRIWERN
jgi:hypothetical protein